MASVRSPLTLPPLLSLHFRRVRHRYLPRLAVMIKAMLDPATVSERLQLATRAEMVPVELMNGREQVRELSDLP